MSEQVLPEITLPARRAVYAGSFDPPTIGHLAVVEAGITLFDELHVAVAESAKKRGKTMFTPEERLEMFADYTQGLLLPSGCKPNITFGSFNDQYTVNYAKRNGFTHLLRGLRSASDLPDEMVVAATNTKFDPSIKTCFVATSPELAVVSSSQVKGLVGYEQEDWERYVGMFVSPFVVAAMRRKLAE